MFRLSISECLIIGSITILCGFIIQVLISILGEEEIKENNIFSKFGKHLWFYILLFIIGMSIHIFISYLDLKNWSCEKQCIGDICNIICTIPVNGLTQLLLVK